MEWKATAVACLTVYLTACLPGFLLGFVVVFVGPVTCACFIARPFLSAKNRLTSPRGRFYELGPTFSIDLSLRYVAAFLNAGGVGVCGGQNTPCAFGSLGEGAIINVVANMLCTRKHKESRVAVARASVTRRQSAFVHASRSTLRPPPVFSIVRLINAMPADLPSKHRHSSHEKNQNEILKSKRRIQRAFIWDKRA